MTIRLVSNEKIAETSSKGNQEKWFDKENGKWYKLDQFGYEALAETLISALLNKSNIKNDTPFSFVDYEMEKINIRNRIRTGCSSDNFLQDGQSIVTLSHLFSKHLGFSVKEKLSSLPSDKKRLVYLAEATADITNLKDFPAYLTLLFEVDALFLNDDRHLNNIAILEKNGTFDYCPIFDNGAALLSNTQFSPMDIEPQGLIKDSFARPLHLTFTRQMNTMRNLYGQQLHIPQFTIKEIQAELEPLLPFYAERDRGLIADRVITTIRTRQKFNL